MDDSLRWEAFETALEVGGPLRFFGSERDIAEQFLLAVACLRDRIYSGGAVGIDYEKLAMPVASSPGMGFGGWLMDAVPVFHELRDVYEEAVEGLDDWQVDVWVDSRKTGAGKASERKLAKRTGRSKTQIHNTLTLVDRCIVGRLRVRGFVVRGER